MSELVASVLLVAMGAVGLTVLLRALVPSRWVESVRPWSCDLCMSWWSSVICIAVAFGLGYGTIREAVIVLLPAFALSYFVQQRVHPEPASGSFPGPPIDPQAGE